ncbi:hypothetical protein MKW94_017825 [Papaver nudicaule]|uniref:Peptidase M20 dimerisation domain-containing protein n=1 Tax=Papaver nudicaule TaxID=74823 RepID=A0AA41VNL1_PAPNU|nr:hypothetical protein [Papaver nudicaule]
MGFWRLFTSILILNLFLSNSLSSAELSEIPTNFLNYAKQPEVVNLMVDARRRIHQNPEVGFEEFETSKLIRNELDKMGIEYKHPIAVTGVVGMIGTGEPPFVAIRADMDALPMQESVEWEHKSKVPGKMHACGHDAHVAMLLGAAKILQDHRQELKGTVVLVFQPPEEGAGGAKKVVEDGILENIDAIFGLHVSVDLPIGSVASRPGALLAGSGSIPQQTIDPILAASNVIVSLQHLVSREADPLDSQVVTVGKFQGGEAFNVIPDSVTIGGTFRAFSTASFMQLKKRIEEVIKAEAAVQRCNATVDFSPDNKISFPVTTNNKVMHKHLENVAGDMLGTENVKDMQPSMGSEDFSFYSEVIPGCFFFLGMANETRAKLASWHSPNFTINEDALPYGAALHASVATRYLLEFESKSHISDRKVHDEL